MDIGAIVAPSQLSRITELVNQGVADGAEMWQPSWACPTDGYFYPPTLFTGVSPSAMIAQVEIFGPVLVSMTFRTPSEAVSLANNTPYGLAASVWTENINLALDIAPKIKAGVVWVNSSNLFDAAVGFGGYRESGFGREGGREGMYEYLHAPAIPRADARAYCEARKLPRRRLRPRRHSTSLPGIDRTPKLFIGGKQSRPDAGGSRRIESPSGALLGEVAEGNRKDIRNAVEAAHAASGWPRLSGHARAQVLYYIAENLAVRAGELASRIASMTGGDGAREVEVTLSRLFTLRRVGGQVRRRGARSVDSRRRARNARAHGRDRHRRAGRLATAWIHLARGASDRHGQHRRRDPVGALRRSRRRISTRCSRPRTFPTAS